MNDLKWADVAHMYINSDIRAVYGEESVFLVECRANLLLYQYCDEAQQDFPLEDIDAKPILRHLEDMTEEECIDLWEYLNEGDSFNTSRWVNAGAVAWWQSFLRMRTESHGLEASPVIHYWLLSRGFDLYRLIEKGEAIRKEASNG